MISLSVERPVAVGVGVIIVLLFGLLSLEQIPIQLTPEIVRPQITVETVWTGATPHEIERDVIDEQEEQLKGVEGLDRLTSESLDGLGRITLEFPAGTDLDAALIRVSNRLEQVPEYPADADKPVIRTTNKTDNAMAWFMLYRMPGNTRLIDEYYRFADDVIKPRLERVAGVGSANIFGGREQEVQVILELEKLAARGITITDVMRALDRENLNLSAGDFDEGKRKLKVRTIAEYVKAEDIGAVVLETTVGRRVYLRDVATVRVGLKKRDNFVRQRGEPTVALNTIRGVGANVIETMARLQEAIRELNAGVMLENRVQLRQVYDETDYIDSSIENVARNLLLGSVLATAILYLFLRSIAATIIVAVSIPISVIGSFVFLFLLGRSINVISLAGMSFASGMVVDNAIVSLENIFRLSQEGRSRFEAALEGAREIWGAILASTLTTIAVFVPVLFAAERAAQLFRDIAIAISCSVGLSLIVSITVIPALAAKFLAKSSSTSTSLPSAANLRRGLFAGFRDALAASVAAVVARMWARAITILVLTGTSLWLAYALIPQAEYLPVGNRNLTIGVILPPPGYSVEELSGMGRHIETRIASYYSGESSEEGRIAEASETAAGASEEAPATDGPSAAERTLIRHFFYVARQGSVFMGAVADDPARARALIPVLQGAVADIPGLITVVQQASLFERGLASGRRIDLEITGPELERLIDLGGAVFGQILGRFPFSEGHQARPIPSLDLDTPEVHVIPDRERTKDLGFDARDLAVTVDVMIDGAKASEMKLDGREVDLTVMGSDELRQWRTQDLEQLSVSTPVGQLVPLGSLAAIRLSGGPQQINHVERDRAITIQFVPSRDLPLEEAVTVIRDQIVEPLRKSGAVAPPYRIELAGTADDLYEAFLAFRWNFVLAVVLVYLLMAALFESYLYPLIILFSVPLAAVGGVVGLNIVHGFIPDVRLDILTMLGFVILVGVVVNNAILIVHRSLQAVRDGRDSQAAVVDAVRSRIRPIFMTTLTSGFGMLPLVIVPGLGSELYRGLGSVVVGGLLVSTVFTVFLIPALLSLVLEIQMWFSRKRRGSTGDMTA